MRLRTRVAAAALAVPLTLGLGACGDTTDSSHQPSAPGGRTSAAPLKAAPPIRLTSATFMPALNSANKKINSVEATARVSAAGQLMTMKLALTVKPYTMKLDMSTPDGRMQLLLVKSTMYVSAPGAAPTGKFLKVDLKTSKDPELRALAGMLDNVDPTKMYKAWNKGGIKVKFVKSELIGYRKVDRYLMSIDTAKVLASVPKGLPKTIRYNVWLGPDHLPYKMSFALSGVDVQITMTGYNTVSPITGPPASKIVTQR